MGNEYQALTAYQAKHQEERLRQRMSEQEKELLEEYNRIYLDRFEDTVKERRIDIENQLFLLGYHVKKQAEKWVLVPVEGSENNGQ